MRLASVAMLLLLLPIGCQNGPGLDVSARVSADSSELLLRTDNRSPHSVALVREIQGGPMVYVDPQDRLWVVLALPRVSEDGVAPAPGARTEMLRPGQSVATTISLSPPPSESRWRNPVGATTSERRSVSRVVVVIGYWPVERVDGEWLDYVVPVEVVRDGVRVDETRIRAERIASSDIEWNSAVLMGEAQQVKILSVTLPRSITVEAFPQTAEAGVYFVPRGR
jgi:hypothetical protein